jgi:ketosteroid isomerase-like protein
VPEHAPEISRIVHRWLEAKQTADATEIGALLTPFRGALAIGTDHDEWWEGQPAFVDAHTGGGPFTARIDQVEAYRHGDVAWASVRGAIGTTEPDTFAIRMTLVLVHEHGGWKIVQSHASTPDRG